MKDFGCDERCLLTISELALPFSSKRGLRDMFSQADSSRDIFHRSQDDPEKGRRAPEIRTILCGVSEQTSSLMGETL